MPTYPFCDICQVWQRQAYRGTVLLQNPEEPSPHYFVLRDKKIAYIAGEPPTNRGIVDHIGQITGKNLAAFDSPLQIVATNLLEEFNNALGKFLLDRMYGLINQSFSVTLKPEIVVDVNHGIGVDYLLQRLLEKQKSWHQYISGQATVTAREETHLTLADLVSFPLSQAQEHDRVYLHRLSCADHNPKLLGMGFAPGVAIEVVHRLPNGGVMVGLQEQRLGLGAEMAAGMAVIHAQDWDQVKLEEREVKLATVPIGARLRVIGYENSAKEYKRKLLAMGLTPGVDIVLKHQEPLELEVRGFNLSLQPQEADALKVRLISGEYL